MILKKIIEDLNLRRAWGIELYFAFMMILYSYSFMGIPLQVILWGGLFVYLFFKKKKEVNQVFRPLIILTVFILIHDFVYLFIANGNLNAYIMQIIYLGCIFLAVKVFNIEKLKGALNFVAIISIMGLLYQWSIIATGGDVRPIQIPFLDMAQNRLETYSIRPSSFFMEPAAYVAFMYVPLAFSLIDGKYIWSVIIILSEFLTTSTTGLLTSFIIIIAYIFTQKGSLKMRLLIILLGGIMFFSLIHVRAFQTGVDKLVNTDVETNIRLTQGAYVVNTMMAEELLLGAPYHSAYDYCLDGRAPNVLFYDNEVYMSTIWMLILKYGFVGLFLYMLFYIQIVRKKRESIPLVLCLCVTMFSSAYGLGGTFVYTSIPLLLLYYDKNIKIDYGK